MTLALPDIPAIDRSLEPALRARLDGKAKPPGSLGRIETLAVQLGLIQNRLDPRIETAALYVFAGDHGLTAEGVSAYPSSVTAAMMGVFLQGRASVNVFARAAGIAVRLVDAGVASDLPHHPDLIRAKIRHGTRNAAREPAMTGDEATAALRCGIDLARAATARGGGVVGLGEMGIGNTASSALIMHRLLPAPLADCIGVGAGHDPAGLARKRAALERAAARSDATRPMAVLAEFGGYEIAMMAGAVLGAASMRGAVIVDGFISTAAALIAIGVCPPVRDYCIFAHRSAEHGHQAMLTGLGAEPLLDLGLRLGEGTGAALAIPLLRAAAALLTDVADLADVLGASA